MSKKFTQLKKIHIKRFRGLQNVEIDFANRVTLICGKNGTSKSTILGIIAQIFSFRKAYTHENADLTKYKSLMHKNNFESRFSDHFRFSERYDTAGSMDVSIQLFDGLENEDKNNLTLKLNNSADRKNSRPILRGNNDRNVTHPVIYLSVNRLTPIVTRDYLVDEDSFLTKNNDLALKISNQILLKENTSITSTGGAINSLAPHNDSYDYQSISVGEDNVGQMVRALLSFKKLKEEYEYYSGGILLIDEVDAGLFPAAQIELFKILRKYSKDLNLQIVMTSHSPTLIQEVFNERDTQNYKINYLTDTFGPIQVSPNLTWSEIEADIHVKTVKLENELELPNVTIYCEDIEAREFFKSLITKRKLNKIITISQCSLGSEQLMTLAKEKVPEFTKKSIVVLDADKSPNGYSNFVKLPGAYPPDQLLYNFLINKNKEDEFWRNSHRFTRDVFIRTASDYLGKINLPNKSNEKFDLSDHLSKYKATEAYNKNHGLIRESFKNFYKSPEIQKLLKLPVKQHPFRIWAEENQDSKEKFESDFIKALKYVLINGYRVPKNIIDEYFIDL